MFSALSATEPDWIARCSRGQPSVRRTCEVREAHGWHGVADRSSLLAAGL